MSGLLAALCWALSELYVFLAINPPDEKSCEKFKVCKWNSDDFFNSDDNAKAFHDYMNATFYAPLNAFNTRAMLCPKVDTTQAGAIGFKVNYRKETGCIQTDEVAWKVMRGKIGKEEFVRLVAGDSCKAQAHH